MCYRCSRFHCFDKIDDEAQKKILYDFNTLANKNAQDSHLCGLIAIHSVVRKRPRNAAEETHKDHAAAYTYKVRLSGRDVPICQKAFVSVHGITKSRLYRLQQSLLVSGHSPTDKRGTHANRPKKTPCFITSLIEQHINSFHARKSHYSLRDNPHKKYLPEDLTIALMHASFLKLYHINVPYRTYWSVMKTFNIAFGYPRSDTCTICDSNRLSQLSTQSVTEKSQLDVEYKLHLKRAEAFTKYKQTYIMRAKEGTVTCITFDFMQNLPLPHIPSNVVYYSRQLWYNVFGVHNLADGSATMYRYLEHEGKKGPNEVISMIFHFINNFLPETQRCNELVLISDGCPGQNKNRTMVFFIYCLVHVLKLFHKVTYLFPIRGHSYLPNDQDFALIGVKKKKTPSAEVPEVWDENIKTARKHPQPFNLQIMHYNDFKDWKSATDSIFLKTPKPPLKLQQVRMIHIEQGNTCVKLKNTYNGPWSHHIVQGKGYNNSGTINLPQLYDTYPGLTPAKIKDVQNLLQYLSSPTHVQYYEKLFNCLTPHQTQAENDDNVEVDNDDNSDGYNE